MFRKVYNNIVDQSLFSNGEFYANIETIGVYNIIDQFLVERINKKAINMNLLNFDSLDLKNGTINCILNPRCPFNNILNIFTLPRLNVACRVMLTVPINKISVLVRQEDTISETGIELSLENIENYKNQPTKVFTIGPLSKFESLELLLFLSTKDHVRIDQLLFGYIVDWFFRGNHDVKSFFNLNDLKRHVDTFQIGYNLFRFD